jgi:hypothetical protein
MSGEQTVLDGRSAGLIYVDLSLVLSAVLIVFISPGLGFLPLGLQAATFE